MAIQIRTAERKKAKLRVGMSGPSGSGKTYSALLVARGLSSAWDKILLIDSESGRGELYSELGKYKIITLEAPFTPERYIEAIKAGEAAGMETIIIDSTSHEWDGSGGCLEINEKLASAKFKGNTWAAWSETTPRHRRFIEAIISSPCHILTTARSKTDTIQTEDKKIKKVGLKEIQREGFEYELTVNFNLDREGHNAIASKDNTHLFDARDPFVISQKTGEELAAWSNSGADLPDPVFEQKKEIMRRAAYFGIVPVEMKAWVEAQTKLVLDPANFTEIITRLDVLAHEKRTTPPEAENGPVAPTASQVEETAVSTPEPAARSEPAAKSEPPKPNNIPGTSVEYPDEEINPEDIPF